MRVSLSWLSELVDLSEVGGPTPLGRATALGELLTRRGLEVEAIERQDQGLEKVVTVQILERNPHPQSDRLSLCQVSLGSGAPLEIVCGAQNMKAGDIVALAQIGAELPNGMKIGESKIRGVTSFGMLCSEAELKFKEESEGILILPPTTPLGVPLAKVLGKDDILLVLKLTANRGDCLSHYGIAREVGAALGKKPKFPSNHSQTTSTAASSASSALTLVQLPISIELNSAELAPQFYGCLIEGVKVGPSPEWMVKRLETLGHRSINNIVDATNLTMLELGQPTHAYDAKQIQGNKIQTRMAKAGEVLPLLDGKEIQLTGTEIVIADQNRAISLAGVMGGGNSEVQPNTQTLFLECAEFDPSSIRRASTQHQRKTEASHRFERGIDPNGLQRAITRLAERVVELAGGKIVGFSAAQLPSRMGESTQSRSQKHPDSNQASPHSPIQFSTYSIHDFLGFPRDQKTLTLEKIEDILKSLDCQVSRSDSGWKVIAPSYRLDLNIQEDFAEEVARSIGYDLIPETIPPLSGSPVFGASSLPRLTLIDQAKDILVKLGLCETINLSFTSQAWLTRFGFSSSVKVLNPLSEEYEYMVPSLIPGVIRNALDNWSHHFGSEPLAIRLFELRPVFSAARPIQASQRTETGVSERWKLTFMIAGPRFAGGLRSERGEVDFYDLKAVVDTLLSQLGARGVRVQPMSQSRTGGNALFHPGQSAEILIGNSVGGHFGLLHPRLARELKTRTPVWLAELDWDGILKLSRKAFEVPVFKAWSEMPPIERDFALLVKSDVTAEKICQLALKSGKPLAKSAKVFDIYKGSQVAEGMTSVAVRVVFYEEGRSLQESEAEAASARVLEAWKKELGAELRG